MNFENVIETSFSTEVVEARSTQRRSARNTLSRGISSAPSAPLRALRGERLTAALGIAMAIGSVA